MTGRTRMLLASVLAAGFTVLVVGLILLGAWLVDTKYGGEDDYNLAREGLTQCLLANQIHPRDIWVDGRCFDLATLFWDRNLGSGNYVNSFTARSILRFERTYTLRYVKGGYQ